MILHVPSSAGENWEWTFSVAHHIFQVHQVSTHPGNLKVAKPYIRPCPVYKSGRKCLSSHRNYGRFLIPEPADCFYSLIPSSSLFKRVNVQQDCILFSSPSRNSVESSPTSRPQLHTPHTTHTVYTACSVCPLLPALPTVLHGKRPSAALTPALPAHPLPVFASPQLPVSPRAFTPVS